MTQSHGHDNLYFRWLSAILYSWCWNSSYFVSSFHSVWVGSVNHTSSCQTTWQMSPRQRHKNNSLAKTVNLKFPNNHRIKIAKVTLVFLRNLIRNINGGILSMQRHLDRGDLIVCLLHNDQWMIWTSGSLVKICICVVLHFVEDSHQKFSAPFLNLEILNLFCFF